MRRHIRRSAIALGALAVIGASGAGVAIASSDDDGSQTAITGVDLERATDAALAETGEGKVTETEVGDEESKYEVEVTLPDGRQVDVQLDEEFRVVSQETDGETEDDR